MVEAGVIVYWFYDGLNTSLDIYTTARTSSEVSF